MSNRIAVISGSSTLTKEMKKEINRQNLDILVTEVATLKVVDEAEEMLLDGIKILISRGNTAAVLRKNFDVPVVDIKHTFFDCFKAYKKAKLISDKIAFLATSVEFRRMIDKSIGFLDGVEVYSIDLLSGKEAINSKLKTIIDSGIEVAIGGLTLKKKIEQMGIAYIMSEADPDSIREAIEDALHLLKIEGEREERRIELDNKYQTINSIFNCVSDGIISTDSDGIITNINKKAISLLNGDFSGKPIDQVIKSKKILKAIAQGKSIYGEILKREGIHIFVNIKSILVGEVASGVVITLQKTKKIQAVEQKIRQNMLNKGHVSDKTFEDIIGSGEAIKTTINFAKKYSKVDSTLLITGETGTGKEVFAKSIHNFSNRRDTPFVVINCAAFPTSVLESELFGYVKGAFTGASDEGKPGMFELAHRGTIFLDEISETPLDVQLKLLRVIQEKKIIRIGDDKVIPIDVRIITASNKNLKDLVEKGLFREDLYYRICVLELYVPSLEERREDIPLLINYFISESKTPVKGITNKAMDILASAKWPGNVRHLSNIIERLVVLSGDSMITSDIVESATDLHSKIDSIGRWRDPLKTSGKKKTGSVFSEENLIKKALIDSKGNRKMAANYLGISTTTLWRKMNKIESIDDAFLRAIKLEGDK